MFYFREPLQTSDSLFGLNWRDFTIKFYNDVIQNDAASNDYGSIVKDDFSAFYLNRKSFNERVASNLATVGIFRPTDSVQASSFFNMQIRMMKKRFDLGESYQ